MDWGDLLRVAVHDRTNPPLFYALLKVWIGVGGTSVAWTRLLPCLTGIAAAVPLAALARRAFAPLDAPASGTAPGTSPGTHLVPARPLVAAAVTLAVAAASPLAVFLSNELRAYSLLLLLGATSLVAFARMAEASGWLEGEPGALQAPDPHSPYAVAASEYRRRAVLLGVANTLLVYTHYFGWLLVAAEVGAALFWKRRALKAIVVTAAVTAAAFAPWALAVLADARGAPRALANVEWISRPGVADIAGFYDSLVARVLTPGLAWIGAVVVIVPLVAMAFALRSRSAEVVRHRVWTLLWFAGFPVAAVFAASLAMDRSAFVPRYLLVAAPAWWMVVGLAVTHSVGPKAGPGRVLAAALAFCAFTLASGALRQVRGGEKIAWDRLTAAIAADAGPAGGTVYAMEGFTALPLAYYARVGAASLAIRPARDVGDLRPPGWLVLRETPGAGAGQVIASLAVGRVGATVVLRDSIPSQRVVVLRLEPGSR